MIVGNSPRKKKQADQREEMTRLYGLVSEQLDELFQSTNDCTTEHALPPTSYICNCIRNGIPFNPTEFPIIFHKRVHVKNEEKNSTNLMRKSTNFMRSATEWEASANDDASGLPIYGRKRTMSTRDLKRIKEQLTQRNLELRVLPRNNTSIKEKIVETSIEKESDIFDNPLGSDSSLCSENSEDESDDDSNRDHRRNKRESSMFLHIDAREIHKHRVARKHALSALTKKDDQQTVKAESIIGKQAAMSSLIRSTGFDHEKLLVISTKFKMYCNEQGLIDFEAFRTVMKEYFGSFGSSTEDILSDMSGIGATISNFSTLSARLFTSFDTDGDGAIDFREFVAGLNRFVRTDLAQKVDILFDTYDRDGSGTISVSELVSMLDDNQQKIVHLASFIDQYFAQLDVDGDNHIEEEEFVKAVLLEPIILDSIANVVPFSNPMNFAERQAMRELTTSLDLNWRILSDMWIKMVSLSRENDADVREKDDVNRPIMITSSEFNDIIFQFLKTPTSKDGAMLAQVFLRYRNTADENRGNSVSGGRLLCRPFISDMAMLIHVKLMGLRHDEDRARFYFRLYDINQDGSLSREELFNAICGHHGDTGGELMTLVRTLNECDVDGDGQISKNEYLAAAKKSPLLMATIQSCL